MIQFFIEVIYSWNRFVALNVSQSSSGKVNLKGNLKRSVAASFTFSDVFNGYGQRFWSRTHLSLGPAWATY